MTEAQAKAELQIWIDAELPRLEEKMADHLLARGYFWNGNWTCAEPPDVLAGSKDPDRLKERSASGEMTWEEFGLTVGKLPASLMVDQYGGPGRRGYVLRIRYQGASGKHVEKSINRGPEAWRELDWREVEGIL